MSDGFRSRVAAALTAPLDGPLTARFVAPLVTALVARADEGPELADALAEVSAALARVGVPPGRQYVLLAGERAAERGPARARELRARLELPVLVHDPARTGFVAGRLPGGAALELDDELREAEAIVVLAALGRSPAAAWSAATVVCPDACSARTRVAFAAARSGDAAADWELSRHCERAARLDLLVWWDAAGGGR
ncbi:MAG: hypothetical protein ABL977_16920 [Candidatus Eisenbacteria bacterium]